MKNIRKIVNLREVLRILFCNMFWSLLGVVGLYFCPLRALTDTHVVVKMFLVFFTMELWFYHVHVLFHHPQLYSRIHKIHHYKDMVFPYALTAVYGTAYELIFLNIFSVSLGITIFQPPVWFVYFWYILVAANTTLAHSGLQVPFFVDNYHDMHHTNFSTNYGLTSYLDWLYGTAHYEQIEAKEV